jgi:hypothetical protein
MTEDTVPHPCGCRSVVSRSFHFYPQDRRLVVLQCSSEGRNIAIAAPLLFTELQSVPRLSLAGSVHNTEDTCVAEQSTGRVNFSKLVALLYRYMPV